MEGRSGRSRARLWHSLLCNWLSHGASHYQAPSIQPQRRTPIDELSDLRSQRSAVSQATYTRYADKVSNKMSNSPAQKRAHHQVSLPDALPPPLSPTRPGLPILTGYRSEGLLTVENDPPLWTGEEITIRRTSFAEHLATTANRLDGM